MLTYEYKLDGKPTQYAAIDEGIRVMQFIRNKCLRAWMDRTVEGKSKAAMSAYTQALPVCGAIGFPSPSGSIGARLESGRAVL